MLNQHKNTFFLPQNCGSFLERSIKGFTNPCTCVHKILKHSANLNKKRDLKFKKSLKTSVIKLQGLGYKTISGSVSVPGAPWPHFQDIWSYQDSSESQLGDAEPRSLSHLSTFQDCMGNQLRFETEYKMVEASLEFVR